ncbi:hypothetical protein HRbin10_01003 [bacterium HR10]|nr:hypothetical protein HRbin10_01003 [bacterium HR10]
MRGKGTVVWALLLGGSSLEVDSLTVRAQNLCCADLTQCTGNALLQ